MKRTKSKLCVQININGFNANRTVNGLIKIVRRTPLAHIHAIYYGDITSIYIRVPFEFIGRRIVNKYNQMFDNKLEFNKGWSR